MGRVNRLRMACLNNSAGSGNIGLMYESQIGGVWVGEGGMEPVDLLGC